MNTAFRYIKDNNGVDGESCYPYRARVSYTNNAESKPEQSFHNTYQLLSKCP